jgi:hypothetical protein
MITFSLETISPSDAIRILAEHDEAVAAKTIINRQRKPAAVKRYAADMMSGSWNAETGETLKFETTDKTLRGDHLVDGQNRLKAVEIANLPVMFYVARGVAREAFAYIDGGEKRKLNDVLYIAGEPDAMILSSALQWLAQWDFDKGVLMSKTTASIQRMRRLLDSDPAIRVSVERAKSVKHSKLIPIGIAAFLHRLFSKENPALADRFIDVLSGKGGVVEGDGLLVLQNALILNKESRRKLNARDIIALSLKGYVAQRDGRKVKILRLTRGETVALNPQKTSATRDDVGIESSSSAQPEA